VAKRAGVSTATVSRVVNNPASVARATLDRVLRVMQETGWTPNETASSLRSRRSRRLLVLVPDLADGLFAVVLASIERAAAARNYLIIAGQARREPKSHERQLALVRRQVADGLIIAGHIDPSSDRSLTCRFLRAAKTSGMPAVLAMEPPTDAETPAVRIDDAAAGAGLMSHLLELGHRRIAILQDKTGSPALDDRVTAAQRELRRVTTQTDVRVLRVAPTTEGGRQAGDALLRAPRWATAIFCCTDDIALGVLDAARHADVQIPRDISVVGFNDIRFAHLTVPALTTIAQPAGEIAERCVHTLVESIEGGERRPSDTIVAHRLVIRNSSSAATP
jgi:LacI family repressor for deo operon, udp, cdd, tsx, nupC, and nupG